MHAIRAVLTLGLTLAVGATPGVRAEDVPITLAEALALAERANPELQAASARVDAQAARTDSVRRMRRPRLGISLDWSRTDVPAQIFANKLNAGQFTMADFDVARINDPGMLDHLGTGVSLDVPIDVFGKVGNLAKALAASRDAASAGVRDAAQEIRLRVTEAYRRGQMAGQTALVTERALGVAKAREAEIEARVATGSALPAELLRARARRREREADVAERRGQRRLAFAGLARLLGAPVGTSYVPMEAPPAVAPAEGDEAAWVERALRQRPALEVARRKTAAASAFVEHEKKGRLPDASAFAQLRDDRIDGSRGSQSWAVGVGVRWRLEPSRGTREAASAAEQKAAALDEKAASDQVRLEVALAYHRAVAARERHAAAVGGAEEGREALRVIQERRKAGMATLTDELETETAALGAALLEIGAAAEVAVADAALRRAAGEL